MVERTLKLPVPHHELGKGKTDKAEARLHIVRYAQRHGIEPAELKFQSDNGSEFG